MTLLALLLTPHETNKLNFEVNVILLSSRYAGSAAKILKSKFKLYFLDDICNENSKHLSLFIETNDFFAIQFWSLFKIV